MIKKVKNTIKKPKKSDSEVGFAYKFKLVLTKDQETTLKKWGG